MARRRPATEPEHTGISTVPEGARQRHCAQRDAVPDGGACTIACPAPRRGVRILRFVEVRVLDGGGAM